MEARYIDDLVARRRDANKDGDYSDSGDGIFYAITDVQFSVVAMLTNSGQLHERVAYDSYGTARHRWKDDVDGDGDVDSSDKSLVTGGSGKHIYDSGYDPGADIDRSGMIDSTDAGLVSSTTIAALASGMISDRKSGGPDNTIGYDGYVFNPENLLYTVRYRTLDTGLGRWLERDPAGFTDGMNLFAYASHNPLRYSDRSGFHSSPPEDTKPPKQQPKNAAGKKDSSSDKSCDCNPDTFKPTRNFLAVVTTKLGKSPSEENKFQKDAEDISWAKAILDLLSGFVKGGKQAGGAGRVDEGLKNLYAAYKKQHFDIWVLVEDAECVEQPDGSGRKVVRKAWLRIDLWSAEDFVGYQDELELRKVIENFKRDNTSPDPHKPLDKPSDGIDPYVPPPPPPPRPSEGWPFRKPGPPRYCFAQGTQVLTEHGYRAIESLTEGTVVIGAAEGSTLCRNLVIRRYDRAVESLFELCVGGEVVFVTGEHPVWVINRGWTMASDLRSGDMLLTAADTPVTVDTIDKRVHHTTVYNLHVSGSQTFFVTIKELLVHNKPP